MGCLPVKIKKQAGQRRACIDRWGKHTWRPCVLREARARTLADTNIHLDLKFPQRGDAALHPQAHRRVQLFGEVLVIVLPLNKCVLLNSAFHGNDVKHLVNMGRGLCETSRLKCEDSHLKLHCHNYRTFTSSN